MATRKPGPGQQMTQTLTKKQASAPTAAGKKVEPTFNTPTNPFTDWNQGAVDAGFNAWNGGATDDSKKDTTSTGPALNANGLTDEQQSLYSMIESRFSSFGMTGMKDMIINMVKRGLSSDEALIELRQSPQYKAVFPAMDYLVGKGIGWDESMYIAYKGYADSYEKMYGLPKGMLTNNVTTLLMGDVSADEMLYRVKLAAADSITAPDDLKKTLQSYFNVDPDQALRAYYLDPKVALPILQEQSATARIGVWAARNAVGGIGVDVASELQKEGVSEAEAQAGFANVGQETGLSVGRGETISTADLARADITKKAPAVAKKERVAGSRTAAFAGGGGFADGKDGVSGLASSST